MSQAKKRALIINCVAYVNGSRLAELPVETISDYLKKAGLFRLGGAIGSHAEKLDQMQLEFDLHNLAVEDAWHGYQCPKIEDYGDSLFAVMHQIKVTEGHHHVSEVNVFVGSNYVLSLRHNSQQNFFAVRERCEKQ